MSQLQEIVQALTLAKIPFKSGFASIEKKGIASADCKPLQDEILNELQIIIKSAINEGGFTPVRKKAIADLSEIAVKLCDRKYSDAAKLAKLKSETSKILVAVKTSAKEENKMAIKEEMLKWIDSSLQGAEAMKNYFKDGFQLGNVQKSAELLTEIRGIVDGVWDNLSKRAADHASDMIDALSNWRYEISLYMCTSEGISALQEVKKSALAWKELCQVPAKKEQATPKYLEEKGVSFVKDDFDRIANSRIAKEKIQVFIESVANYNEITNSQYNVEEQHAKVEELKTKQTAYKYEGANLYLQFQMKQISALDFQEQVSELNEQMEEIKAELEEEKDNLAVMKSDKANRDAVGKEYIKIVTKLKSYERDPMLLDFLAQQLDFNQMTAALWGKLTSQQAEDNVLKIMTTLKGCEMQSKQARKAREEMAGVRIKIKQQRQANDPVRVQPNTAQTEAEMEQNALAMLKQMGLDLGPVADDTPQVVTQTQQRVTLTDDDN